MFEVKAGNESRTCKTTGTQAGYYAGKQNALFTKLQTVHHQNARRVTRSRKHEVMEREL